jgi:hypothetical protein
MKNVGPDEVVELEAFLILNSEIFNFTALPGTETRD